MPYDGTELPQVAIDLMAAKQWLLDHGWCQGTTRQGERSCAIGAVYRVTGDQTPTPEEVDRRSAAFNILCDTPTLEGEGGFIADWNDKFERKIEDVYDLYDEAIACAMR